VIGVKSFCYYATIPINVALVLWVWIGRALFGSGGWWMLIFLVSVTPAMIVALTVTSILAIRQRQPASVGFLTNGQFWWLLAMWASLLLFGFFVVDFGDTRESISSAFSQLAGAAAVDASNALSLVVFVTAIGAYVGLLIQLIIGQGGRLERRSLQQQTLPDPLGWAPGPLSPPEGDAWR
jgi:hypothetical protein